MIRNATLLTASAAALAAALALTTPALAQSAPDAAAAPEIELLIADDAASADTAEPATPTMSFGSWGVDPALLSDTVRPGDDFFGYVNQEWLDANPLPAEYSRFGAFTLLGEKSTSDVKALMDELVAKVPAALNRDEKRLVDAYQAYLDTAAIDAAGLAPIQPYLDQIAGVNSLEALAMVWAEPGISSPVGGAVNVDAKQPDRYVAYLGFGAQGLPSRDYYLDETEKGREIQAKYREYLAFLLGEAGYADPNATAAAVYAFEDRVAREVEWDRAVQRNRDLTYNVVSLSELNAMGGALPVGRMLDKIGLTASPIFVVGQIPPNEEKIKQLGLDAETVAKIGSGFPGMLKVLGETRLDTLKAWTVKSMLSGNAAILPTAIDEANFKFYGQTLRGTPEQRPRWKRAIAATEGMLGELLGKSYVARYFPPENKAAMDELVANLRLALAESINELGWMGPETKAQALEKLATFDPKIGYRDELETYDGLAITPGNPIANAMAAAKWGQADNIAKLGQPIDRTEWFMLPQTVNAYYNPTKNEIVFPAGILQQPFFALTNDIAVNYGAIGGVIGHEMGHGFDDQGSKSDATGALRNWWTDADRAAFDALGNALVAQYDAFCPLDEGKTCVNGRLTLGENIGDLGGLSMAYRAFKIATKGKQVPVIDGLTGDQRFFIAWAQVWRSQQREDNYRNRLRTDSHSPEEYRTNGVVRNLDEWYAAFGITKDDPMYIPPEQRVRIW